MDYFVERNIVEIKGEYTTFLINIMTPFIYEGIRSVYQFALNAHKELIEKGKHDPEVKSPGILKLFQVSLKEIPTLNNNSIEIETNRIKAGCKCADWFDDLVKAVVKSNIILLTFSNPKKRSQILKEKYHDKIEVKDFVHKCYIESARLFYNNPELFWHEFPPLEIKRNQREACELIKQAIQEAIRKMLPIKLILKEYLQNDYMEENEEDISNKISEGQYMNIHAMVRRDLNGEVDPSGRQPIKVNSVLESEEDLMEGGDPDNDDNDDYTAEEQSEPAEEDLMAMGEDDYDESLEGGQPQTDDNDSGNEYLVSVKDRLETMENEQPVEQVAKDTKEVNEEVKDKQTTNNQPKSRDIETHAPPPTMQTQQQQPAKVEVKPEIPKEVSKPPNTQTGGVIPKAEMDDEIKNLLKRSNMVTTMERPKTKMTKKEALLMKEIENQIKPKIPEPDKKIFFEKYMK